VGQRKPRVPSEKFAKRLKAIARRRSRSVGHFSLRTRCALKGNGLRRLTAEAAAAGTVGCFGDAAGNEVCLPSRSKARAYWRACHVHPHFATERSYAALVAALERRGPLMTRMEHMGSTSDKVSGLANQAAGKVKEGVGKATGDAKLETEGAAQDAKGKVQKGIGDAKGAIKDAVNKNL